jgi:hypothetical protein
MAVMPEQWEVVPDEEAPPEPRQPGVSPAPAEPPPAVPVLRHVVEQPVAVEPPAAERAPEPEPAPAREPDQEPEPEAAPGPAFAPAPAPAPAVVAPAPAVVAPAAVAEGYAAPEDRGARVRPAPSLDAEVVPAGERVTSAMVLLLLAVVVGIGLAGLTAAAVLAITLVARRALGG